MMLPWRIQVLPRQLSAAVPLLPLPWLKDVLPVLLETRPTHTGWPRCLPGRTSRLPPHLRALGLARC